MNLFQICSICLYVAFIVHSLCISFKPTQKLLQNSSLNTAAMASSSNQKKRIKQTMSSGRFIDTRGHLESWFAGLHEVTMKITPSIWMALTTIKCEGLKTGK